ncbi:MAG: hypothetical protein ACJAT2_002067 [Bacteriovoracaceae bacterium]|jgi:hypothetical protein
MVEKKTGRHVYQATYFSQTEKIKIVPCTSVPQNPVGRIKRAGHRSIRGNLISL